MMDSLVAHHQVKSLAAPAPRVRRSSATQELHLTKFYFYQEKSTKNYEEDRSRKDPKKNSLLSHDYDEYIGDADDDYDDDDDDYGRAADGYELLYEDMDGADVENLQSTRDCVSLSTNPKDNLVSKLAGKRTTATLTTTATATRTLAAPIGGVVVSNARSSSSSSSSGGGSSSSCCNNYKRLGRCCADSGNARSKSNHKITPSTDRNPSIATSNVQSDKLELGATTTTTTVCDAMKPTTKEASCLSEQAAINRLTRQNGGCINAPVFASNHQTSDNLSLGSSGATYSTPTTITLDASSSHSEQRVNSYLSSTFDTLPPGISCVCFNNCNSNNIAGRNQQELESESRNKITTKLNNNLHHDNQFKWNSIECRKGVTFKEETSLNDKSHDIKQARQLVEISLNTSSDIAAYAPLSSVNSIDNINRLIRQPTKELHTKVSNQLSNDNSYHQRRHSNLYCQRSYLVGCQQATTDQPSIEEQIKRLLDIRPTAEQQEEIAERNRKQQGREMKKNTGRDQQADSYQQQQSSNSKSRYKSSGFSPDDRLMIFMMASRSTQTNSTVERNARILKWLNQTKDARK